MSAADRTGARSGPAEPTPPLGLAPELEAHVGVCPICRDGNMDACPAGLALSHALAAASAAGEE